MLENNQKEIILIEDLGCFCDTSSSNIFKKRRYGLYKCFCGNEFKARTENVNNKNTKSCGCTKRTHGFRRHKLYNVWSAMINRCYSDKNNTYINYGGRGITVCDRWHNIANFIEDMYPSFKDGLTIDRINVNGNYELDNCRWATITLQSRNKRVIQSNNTSGYRGVYKVNKKYKTSICVDNIVIRLGYFNTALEAAKARESYIINNNLEHARNFKE